MEFPCFMDLQQQVFLGSGLSPKAMPSAALCGRSHVSVPVQTGIGVSEIGRAKNGDISGF